MTEQTCHKSSNHPSSQMFPCNYNNVPVQRVQIILSSSQMFPCSYNNIPVLHMYQEQFFFDEYSTSISGIPHAASVILTTSLHNVGLEKPMDVKQTHERKKHASP